MRKIIRLTEGDLVKLIKRVINEDNFINQRGVDKILDKIKKYGRDSLSNEELEILGSPNKEIKLDLDNMVKGYLETAVFTEQERMDNEVQDDYGDYDVSEYIESVSFDNFSSNSYDYAEWDCEKFLSKFSDDEMEEIKEYYDLFDLGCDFWYTRNGHGVGFWDREIPEHIKELLMDVVKGFKEVYLERGDDGELHLNKPSDYSR